jgi:D-lyxose ketol-isomerase
MAVTALVASMTACNCKTSCDSDQTATATTTNIENKKEMTYSKKFTNADFYTDGKFNQEVAIKAMKDMLAFYDVPFTTLMEKDFWVTDFGLGDFENTGMGGIFWVNDAEHGYFAHEIYLLPSQMIPEHAHVKTKYPAKFESWMVQKGMCYNFSAVGEETPNCPKLPESQKGFITSKNFVKQEVGQVVHLKEIETFHFLLAGPQGAVVSEWASFHDDAGLRFTNTKAGL